MLTALTIGVLSSVAAELIVLVNKALSKTVLHGRGAFLLAFAVALVGGAVKVFFFDHAPFSWDALGVSLAQVWTVSQLFFTFVVEALGIDVQPKRDETY